MQTVGGKENETSSMFQISMNRMSSSFSWKFFFIYKWLFPISNGTVSFHFYSDWEINDIHSVQQRVYLLVLFLKHMKGKAVCWRRWDVCFLSNNLDYFRKQPKDEISIHQRSQKSYGFCDISLEVISDNST
jgi:hypothetical protein